MKSVNVKDLSFLVVLVTSIFKAIGFDGFIKCCGCNLCQEPSFRLKCGSWYVCLLKVKLFGSAVAVVGHNLRVPNWFSLPCSVVFIFMLFFFFKLSEFHIPLADFILSISSLLLTRLCFFLRITVLFPYQFIEQSSHIILTKVDWDFSKTITNLHHDDTFFSKREVKTRLKITEFRNHCLYRTYEVHQDQLFPFSSSLNGQMPHMA